ncbi:MAG: CBS domain containing-hemolysin-like protein [Flavobacteriaceae bacterium]|jgi:CBS domain containing-hemolysin-like protein
MATFEELGDKFESKLEKLKNFKIGKTGQTVKERYDQEYSENYSNHEIIGSSDKSKVIDDFEKYMIERFMDLDNCDNEQIGGGEMADSDKYIVYLMSNK